MCIVFSFTLSNWYRYSAFLIDVAGQTIGWKEAIVFPAIMSLFPFALYLYRYCRSGKRWMKKTNNKDTKEFLGGIRKKSEFFGNSSRPGENLLVTSRDTESGKVSNHHHHIDSIYGKAAAKQHQEQQQSGMLGLGKKTKNEDFMTSRKKRIMKSVIRRRSETTKGTTPLISRLL